MDKILYGINSFGGLCVSLAGAYFLGNLLYRAITDGQPPKHATSIAGFLGRFVIGFIFMAFAVGLVRSILNY